MLKAIWPSIAHLPNHLPLSSNITTVGSSCQLVPFLEPSSFNGLIMIGMMCYFIYWLIQFPFMFVSPQRIRYLFMAKALIVPAAWLALLIWSVVKVPTALSLDPEHTSLSGSALSYAYLSSLNSALGIYSTLAVNIPGSCPSSFSCESRC